MYIQSQEIDQLIQLIKEHETIIIHRHVRPDPDAFGSQLGLLKLIEATYPEKKLFAVGTMPESLTWMGTMDQIDNEIYQDALVIVTDTANKERIDDERYNLGKTLVKIDHHPPVDSYGDLQIVHTEASSCSEIIAEISHYLGDKLPMNLEAATLLYAGIVGDTGRFMFDATTETTFLVAARLMAQGIDAFPVNDRFNMMSKNLAKFQGYLMENLQVTPSGAAYFMLTRELLEKFQISEDESNSVVNVPGTIEGIYTWVMFVKEDGDNERWRIRLRSKGPTINDLAAQYDGGGHPKASGAKAKNLEEIDQFIKDLEELTRSYKEELSEN